MFLQGRAPLPRSGCTGHRGPCPLPLPPSPEENFCAHPFICELLVTTWTRALGDPQGRDQKLRDLHLPQAAC